MSESRGMFSNNRRQPAGRADAHSNKGDFSWRLCKSLALGFLTPDLAEIGTEVEIEILGKTHAAKVIEDSPYDPQNERLRA